MRGLVVLCQRCGSGNVFNWADFWRYKDFWKRDLPRSVYGASRRHVPMCPQCGATIAPKQFRDAVIPGRFGNRPKYEFARKKGRMIIRRIRYPRKHGGRGIVNRD